MLLHRIYVGEELSAMIAFHLLLALVVYRGQVVTQVGPAGKGVLTDLAHKRLNVLMHQANMGEQMDATGKHFGAFVALEGLFLFRYVADQVLLQLKRSPESTLTFFTLVRLEVLRKVLHLLVNFKVVQRIEGFPARFAFVNIRVDMEHDVLVQLVPPQVLDIATHHIALGPVLFRVVNA